MKAIETNYDGYRFRSRLEARWAVFFHALGIAYRYEAEGYAFRGVAYLPDFYLPQYDCFVEIKGQQPTAEERLKAKLLALYSGKRVYTFAGDIWVPGESGSYKGIGDTPPRLTNDDFPVLDEDQGDPPGKLAQWLTFFALKDGILYRRVGINEEDAWETASGAATSETFLGIPGTLDASKNDLKVRTVLPGGACVQIFTVKFAGSGKTFEHSAPNLRRRTSTECTKTAGGDSLLERFSQTAKCPIPSFSENFHPSVQKPSTLQLIYHIAHLPRRV